MGIISLASTSSACKGLEYYKNNKVTNLNKISENEYTSKVVGTQTYNVYLNTKHVRKSTCDCPFANGKRIICKHIVATYFKALPSEALEFEKEQERLQEEYDKYEEELYNKAMTCINSMSKKELIQELIYVFDYGPDWLYSDFLRRNNID